MVGEWDGVGHFGYQFTTSRLWLQLPQLGQKQGGIPGNIWQPVKDKYINKSINKHISHISK